MAWDMNELVALGIVVISVTVLTVTGRLAEGNYMMVMSSMMAYTFGRIMNHAQGKEPGNDLEKLAQQVAQIVMQNQNQNQNQEVKK